MHRLLAASAASAALLVALAGCSASPSPETPATHASAAPTSAAPTRTPTAKAPAPAKAAPNYPALAKKEIKASICFPQGPPDCKYIKSYGMIVDALVAHTSLYPDSDATEPARAICGWLLMYVIDSNAPESELSSDAYVYGSTGSRITTCHTPADRT